MKSDLDNDDNRNDEKEVDVMNRYFSFFIDDEEYSIPISSVEEIICYQELTHIPETKKFVVGSINLRGKVIAIMDIRIKLGLEPKAVDNRTCIIVVTHKNSLLGLLVDRVSEVQDIPPNDITSTLDNKEKEYVSKIAKVGEVTKFIVNLDQLLCDESPEISIEFN